MKNILIVYYSRMGHTARMVRTIADELEALGNTVTVMPVSEALREGVDWSKHDFVLCGFPVVYGTYHPNVYEFVRNNCTELDRKPNALPAHRIRRQSKATATCRNSLNALRGVPETSSALPARSTTRT